MNIAALRQIFFISAVISLGLILSTNYFGGNALYFLSDRVLNLVTKISISVCAVSTLGFMLIYNYDHQSYIQKGRYYYSAEAVKALYELGCTTNLIETVIDKGDRKPSAKGARYRYVDDNGMILMVYIDKEGRIVELI